MRKLRAVLVIAGLWGGLWLGLGLVLGMAVMPWAAPDVVPPPVITLPIVFTVWGAASGAAFALLLLTAERRGSLAAISLSRSAWLGALGSILLPVFLALSDAVQRPWGRDDWLALGIFIGSSVLLGALCASGTLAMARRTPR